VVNEIVEFAFARNGCLQHAGLVIIIKKALVTDPLLYNTSGVSGQERVSQFCGLPVEFNLRTDRKIRHLCSPFICMCYQDNGASADFIPEMRQSDL
jgi:hypothetical protein